MARRPARLLILLRRLYRGILRLAPRAFRDRFGAQAEDAFGQLVASEWASRGPRAAMSVATASLGDAARLGVTERVPTWRAALTSGLGSDLRQALRTYGREPGVALTVFVTLTLGVAMTTAAFSVLDTVLLRTLPYRDADRLLTIYTDTDRSKGVYAAYMDLADYRAGVPALASVEGYRNTSYFLEGVAEPGGLSMGMATDGLLDSLGLTPAVGRFWTPGEQDVAVLTRETAQAKFGGMAAAVNQRVTLDGRAVTIVGVLDDSPVFPYASHQAFEPYRLGRNEVSARGPAAVMIIGRLQDGSSFDVAAQQISAVGDRLTEVYKRRDNGRSRAEPLTPQILGASSKSLPWLFGSVLAMYGVALASLVSLFLTRALARSNAVAIARALGASSLRLGRTRLIEGAVMAGPGIAAGALAAAAIVTLVRSELPIALPRFDAIAVDVRVLIFVAGLGLVSVLLMALVPLAFGVRRLPGDPLRAAGRRIAGSGGRLQAGLVGVQVALTLVLVVGAVWLVGSARRVLSIDPGIDLDDVVTTQVLLPRHQFPTPALQWEAVSAIAARMAAHPAVQRAALGDRPPLAGGLATFGIQMPEAVGRPAAEIYAVYSGVTPGYFEAFGIRVLQGRVFVGDDLTAEPKPIVVSQSFVSKALGGKGVGERVPRRYVRELGVVIGVVADVRAGTLEGDAPPQVYEMAGTSDRAPTSLVVRTSLDSVTLESELKAALASLSPRPAIGPVRAMSAILAKQNATRRYAAEAGALVSTLALFLALVNVYALAALGVRSRRRELGVRLALGAPRASVVGLVVRRGLVSTAVGLTAGVVAIVWIVAPAIAALVYETDTSRPTSLVVPAVLLAAVAMFASWLPGRHAARIDPARALREE